MNDEEQAEKALTDALNTADAALTQVTHWCEAIRQDAARRLGPGAADERASGTPAGLLSGSRTASSSSGTASRSC